MSRSRPRCAPTCIACSTTRQGPLRDRLSPLLDRFELDAVRARIEHLLAAGVLPEADGDYHAYPWPTI